MAQKGRGWCFTYNLPDGEKFKHEPGCFAEDPEVDEAIRGTYFTTMWNATTEEGNPIKYLCFQPEIAPSTGKLHYQGYCYYENQVRFGTVKQFLVDWGFNNAHIERANGSASDNIRYCSKDESRAPGGIFYEFGDRPVQGKRSDLEKIADLIEAGESLHDIAIQNPGTYMKFHSGIKAMNALMKCKPRSPTEAPTVYWWFGPTGVGKSRKAFEDYPDAYVMMNSMWWDGYEGEKTVIIDDYRPSLCTFQELLRILDRYPMRVQMKGSSCELSATHFVISTTQRPEVLWYGRTAEALNQLLRRITHIVEFSKNGEEHSQTIWKCPVTNYILLPPDEIQAINDAGPITNTLLLEKRKFFKI